MKISSTWTVKMRWDTFDYPIVVGTPISRDGILSNDAKAIGIVPNTIAKKPDVGEYLRIMTGGIVEPGELGYNLSTTAKQVMNGIKFYGTDGTPEADPQYDPYTLPAASASVLGGVKVGTGLSINSSDVLSVSAATKSAIGAVKMAENVAEAAGDAPTAAEFKALLDALIEAGIMEEAPET